MRYKRKKRSQKVKFRRRYATSIFQKSLSSIWSLTKIAVFTFAISGATIFLWRFWNTSPHLKLERVVYQGDIPSDLRKFLSFREGDNVLLMRVNSLEEAGRSEFPELKKLDISRGFNRTVTVKGQFRKPVAKWGHTRQGVDADGFVFPISSSMKAEENIPMITGVIGDVRAKELGRELALIQSEVPEFYTRLYRIKTDTIKPAVMTLTDGVVIHWGRLEPGSTVEKAGKAMKILRKFTPLKKNASMNFVDEGRIVMDRHWKQIS